jgi:WD40 repeat protein
VIATPNSNVYIYNFLLPVAVCADGAVRVFRVDDVSSKSFKILRINLPAGAHPTAIAFSQGASSVVVAAQALLGSSLYMYADVGAPPAGGNKQQGKLSPPEIKWEHRKIHGKESVLNLAAARATYGTGDGSTILISCSEATDIKIWHGKSGKELGTVDTNQLKNNMADISPNGRFIAAAAFTADVKVSFAVILKNYSISLPGYPGNITFPIYLSRCGRLFIQRIAL